MAQSRTAKTSAKSKSNSQISISRTGMFSFLAAFAGVLVAVPLTVAIVMPMVHQQLVSATAGLSRSVQLKAAADTLSCSQPGSISAVTTSSGGRGQVLGAATTLPMLGGADTSGGLGAGGSTTTLVKKIVTGDFSGTATITNTGTDSTNNVTFTNTATTTVDNTNDINVSNSNSQNASTGSANVSQNTTGGSAQSGDSSNTNSANFNITASN